jgi:hypothetical protein
MYWKNSFLVTTSCIWMVRSVVLNSHECAIRLSQNQPLSIQSCTPLVKGFGLTKPEIYETRSLPVAIQSKCLSACVRRVPPGTIHTLRFSLSPQRFEKKDHGTRSIPTETIRFFQILTKVPCTISNLAKLAFLRWFHSFSRPTYRAYSHLAPVRFLDHRMTHSPRYSHSQS